MLLGFLRWRFSFSVCPCHCKCFPFLKQQGSFCWLLRRRLEKNLKPSSAPGLGWGIDTQLWATSAMLGYSHFKSQHCNHHLTSLAACGPAQTVLVKCHSASNLFSLACTADIRKYLSWGIQGTWKCLQTTGNWGRHQKILCIRSKIKVL